MAMKKSLLKKHNSFLFITRNFLWFAIGVSLGIFFLISFAFIVFEKVYQQAVYPGIFVNGIDFGGKKELKVEKFFEEKNATIGKTTFVFKTDKKEITFSASDIDYGYNPVLLAKQAYSIGRSESLMSNISLVFQAYLNGLYLPASYHFSSEKLEANLAPIRNELYILPVDALFTFQNGKVVTFRPSSDGQDVDMEAIKSNLASKTVSIASSSKAENITLVIPIKITHPKITTEKANTFGIEELLSVGTSLFQGSMPSRIYNITLASARLNGILVEPGEVFSFGDALGDVSSFTGYKQAYIIQNGKTVLGDGGGVCQVSTTLFRALLNAGLPIVERHAHSYRVGYYEEDSDPGFDATVYVPSIDLKFKNDTRHHILIQTSVDPNYERLTISFYGKKDGRVTTLSKAIITNKIPAPEPLYQDDPTLPKGQLKQVDFAASGAFVSFSREVKKNGKVILSDTFTSSYQPWQAIYLRGIKE